jgi:hypothetical protein
MMAQVKLVVVVVVVVVDAAEAVAVDAEGLIRPGLGGSTAP